MSLTHSLSGTIWTADVYIKIARFYAPIILGMITPFTYRHLDIAFLHCFFLLT